MDIKECIICGKEIVDPSIEHVLPAAIGGRKTIRTVCKSCNSLLGEKVDCLLTEDPAIRFLRAFFQIPNRDGKTISILSDLKKIRYQDKDGNILAIKSGDGRTLPSYYAGNPIPKVQVQQKEPAGFLVNWSAMDFEFAFNKAKREFKKQGIVFSDNHLRSLLESSMNQEWSCVAIESDIVAHFDSYVPCAIKIAYEAMCDMFPDYWKEDDLGREYREFLFSAISRCPSSDLKYPQRVRIIPDFWNAQNNHLLVFRKEGDCLYADVCLFCTLQYSVCISHSPEKYDLGCDNGRAYFLT